MAGQGLEIYNASGQLRLSITDRISRILGITTLTSPTDGNITNADFATGMPFWICIPISGGRVPIPDISVSGTTIYWDFTPGLGYSTNYRLIYGVY